METELRPLFMRERSSVFFFSACLSLLCSHGFNTTPILRLNFGNQDIALNFLLIQEVLYIRE